MPLSRVPALILATAAVAAPLKAAPCCTGGTCSDLDPLACEDGGGIAGYCVPGEACLGPECSPGGLAEIQTLRVSRSAGDVLFEWTDGGAANAHDVAFVTDRFDIPDAGAWVDVPGAVPTTVRTAIHQDAVVGADSLHHYRVQPRCVELVTYDWQTVTMRPGPFIHDMEVIGEGPVGYAVGGRSLFGGESISTILRTDDFGLTWQERQLTDVTLAAINDVSFTTEDLGWIVGDDGRAYRTQDGGLTWEPLFTGSTRDLSGVHFIDEAEGWACAESGRDAFEVLHTTDGGDTWEDLSFGTGGVGASDIQFHDSNLGWIAVRDSMADPRVYLTTDGGRTWTESDPIPPDMAGIQDLEFLDESVGFAVGYSSRGAILRTQDGGQSWSVVGNSNLYYNDAIACQKDGRCVVPSFDLASVTARLMRTRNFGDTWEQNPLPITRYMLSIAYVGQQVWIGSNFAQVWGSGDEGLNVEIRYHAPLWYDMAWRDATTGWASTGDYVPTSGYAEVSTDGGLTFDIDRTVPGGRVMQFVDQFAAHACFHGEEMPVHLTRNGGADWVRRSAPTFTWLEECYFQTEERGWIFGQEGLIRRTDDSGATWSPPQPTGTVVLVNELSFLDPNTGWAVGGEFSDGWFGRTTDGGDTWTRLPDAALEHWRAVKFLDTDFGYVAAFGGAVYRTLDGGDTLEMLTVLDHYDIEDIYIHDRDRAWLAARNGVSGSDGRGFIYATEDGGESWQLEWASPWIVNAILRLRPSVDRGTLWAVGENATILERRLP